MLILQLIVIQVVTFIALVFVLRRLLFTEANMEIKRLQKLSGENEKKAEELRKKAERAKAEYEEQLKKAEEDVRQVREKAQKEIEKQQAQVMEGAKIEAEKIIAHARDSKDKIREEIKAELEEKSIDFACDLVKNAFDEKIYKNAHDELLDGIIQEFERIDKNKISDKVKVAEIISPFPVNKGVKEKIKKLISRKASRQIDLNEKIDKDVVAGAIIKIGDLIIDGSLANRMEEARVRLKGKH